MEQYSAQTPAERLAVGLGCFSIALGVAELTAPASVARLIGATPDARTRSTLQALGAREIGHGMSMLTQPDKAWPAWSRVVGDVLDLSLLNAALSRNQAARQRAKWATASLIGVAAADVVCAIQLSRRSAVSERRSRNIHVRQAITINRPLAEVYRFWRSFENFPRFMSHLESVRDAGGTRSHWRARGAGGVIVEWEADIIGDRENEWIAWRTVDEADVHHSGSVRFEHAPGGRGTEIYVDLDYRPRAGAIGAAIARLFGEDPERQIRDDLRRFKQIVEAGEVAVSDGPGLKRPAQPPERPEELKARGGVRQ